MKKLATLTILMSLLLGMSLLAQDDAANAGAEKKKRARKGQDRGSQRLSPRMLDTNKDMQVSKEEIEAGMPKLKERIADAKAKLLAAFDKDGDGKVSEEEAEKIKEMMAALEVIRSVQPFDKDKDMTLSDEEFAALQERFTLMAEKMNKMTLERFDANKDGKVDENEIKAAKEKMRKGRGGKERKGKGKGKGKEAGGNQL